MVPTPMPLARRRVPFDDPDWCFELKYDGFRALALVTPTDVTFVSRRGHPYKQFGALATALRRELRVRTAVLDGELVTLDADGRPAFDRLFYHRGTPVFVAFDLLRLGTRDLRTRPLLARKAALKNLIPAPATAVLYADYVRGDGRALYELACARDLEGVVAKWAPGRYVSTPPTSWIKIKNPAYTQAVGRHARFAGRA